MTNTPRQRASHPSPTSRAAVRRIARRDAARDVAAIVRDASAAFRGNGRGPRGLPGERFDDYLEERDLLRGFIPAHMRGIARRWAKAYDREASRRYAVDVRRVRAAAVLVTAP